MAGTSTARLGPGRARGRAGAGRVIEARRRLHLGLRPEVPSDGGSVTAFVALLLVAMFVLMGLVLDGGSAINAQQAALDEAEQAARAGAGALSVDALRAGSLQIDQQAAVKTAEAFTVAAGHPGTATVSGGAVNVEIHYRIATDILGIVGITSLPVSASASAVDVAGVTAGSP
ncbi:MAG: pilus assembly protein TadG-related protein [Acidimicrobiales bacterium]